MFVDRWQPMLFGKIHDALPVSVKKGVAQTMSA
jgi:hypothetical protein